jgi:hypothetical protein
MANQASSWIVRDPEIKQAFYSPALLVKNRQANH